MDSYEKNLQAQNNPYWTEYWANARMQNMVMTATQEQDLRNSTFLAELLRERTMGTIMFPLAEPATAQKQYARLQAAKAWLKERGK